MSGVMPLTPLHTFKFWTEKIFFVAQQQNSGLGRFMFEVSKSQTIQHKPVGPLCTSDQPIAVLTTHSTHNKQNIRTLMPSVGIETAIPAIEPQTFALDRTATGNGRESFTFNFNCFYVFYVFGVILGFRRGVNDQCTLLGFDAAQGGNFLPTFRDNLSAPS